MWRVQLNVAQPCLHTVLQTRLSANQSARTKFGGGVAKKAAKSEKVFEYKRSKILIGSQMPLCYR